MQTMRYRLRKALVVLADATFNPLSKYTLAHARTVVDEVLEADRQSRDRSAHKKVDTGS